MGSAGRKNCKIYENECDVHLCLAFENEYAEYFKYALLFILRACD